MQNRALGKGLEALIAKTIVEEKIATPSSVGNQATNLPIEKIDSNVHQPRKVFEQQEIENLKQSIEDNGVLQPIIVRKKGDRFEIVAGERRYRAAQLAGIKELPCVVKELNDNQTLKIALIENVQREDLNPMEEAHAYKKLMHDFEYTQEMIAKSVSKNRTTIANSIRLLSLPPIIQDHVSRGTISAGHARALLSVENSDLQIAMCNKIIEQGLNVRFVEDMVKSKEAATIKLKSTPKNKDMNVVEKEAQLQQILGTKVNIYCNKNNKGKIVIEFYSLEDFDRVLGKIK